MLMDVIHHFCVHLSINAFASFATANKHCGDKLCRAITMWSLLFAPFATTLCDHCDFERTATSAPESLDFKGMSDDCDRCDHKSSACGFNKINCLLCGVGLYCLIQ